jgi:hypothetical protein
VSGIETLECTIFHAFCAFLRNPWSAPLGPTDAIEEDMKKIAMMVLVLASFLLGGCADSLSASSDNGSWTSSSADTSASASAPNTSSYDEGQAMGQAAVDQANQQIGIDTVQQAQAAAIIAVQANPMQQ